MTCSEACLQRRCNFRKESLMAASRSVRKYGPLVRYQSCSNRGETQGCRPGLGMCVSSAAPDLVHGHWFPPQGVHQGLDLWNWKRAHSGLSWRKFLQRQPRDHLELSFPLHLLRVHVHPHWPEYQQRAHLLVKVLAHVVGYRCDCELYGAVR